MGRRYENAFLTETHNANGGQGHCNELLLLEAVRPYQGQCFVVFASSIELDDGVPYPFVLS
jgi:hypothetical protein